MNNRKRFIIGLSGILMMQLFQGSYANELSNSTQNRTIVEEQNTEESIQEPFEQEGQSEEVLTDESLETLEDQLQYIEIAVLLETQEWADDHQRIATMIGTEGVLTSSQFAELICYKLCLSPLQAEGENAYQKRLKKEGLWPSALEGDVLVTQQDYIQVMGQLVSYQKKQATPSFLKEVPAGFLNKSTLSLQYNGKSYGLYNLADVNYISLSDLQELGFNKYKQEAGIRLAYENLGAQVEGQSQTNTKEIKGGIALYNDEKIYIGNVLTYSLKCGDERLVPIRSLGEYFGLNVAENVCTLIPLSNACTQKVELTQGKVKNCSTEVLDVEIVSLFWNGQSLIEDLFKVIALQPGEVYPLREERYALDPGIIHTSTMIKSIQSEGNTFSASYKNYGQHTQNVLLNYTKNINQDPQSFVAALFPATEIIGTMKYSTNGLEKGEKVVVWAAEDGAAYHIMKNGKKITVPWSSVSIPSSPVSCKEVVPVDILEAYFNSLNKTSKTPYYIWTDLYRQRTYVFERKNNEWKLIRNMLTSTGLNKTPTPTGEFKINAYVPAFGMDKGYQCKTALHLFGDYLYHSVLFDVKGKYVISGMDRLGERASHGCLRLSPEDSKWLYETMPLGTSVLIR